jgi:hypothetical protein
MKNKKILLSVTALTLAVAGAVWYGGNKVLAGNDIRHDAVVSTLSEKLGVSEDKVTAAFDSIQSERQTARVAERKTELDKAVTAGVITQEQEDKLIAKHAELQANREKERSDMEQWYKDNSIDQTKLSEYTGRGGMGMGKGMGGGKGHMGGI